MKFKTELLDHQRKAVDKLKKLKVGALFMEQGTGKTRTALELINIRLNKWKITHVIWLCPCSVKENLRRDIIKHTGEDQHNLITICGIETLSTSIKWNSYLLDIVNKKSCYLIVDESSKVKNPKAKRTKNITRLSDKCKYKLILNGTPITRNEADLYSQMYILDWRILGYKSYWSFAANHIEYDECGRLRKCLNTDYLAEKVSLYSYQVKKKDCLDLPQKTYNTIYFDITYEQYIHYKNVANDLLFSLNETKSYTIYRFLTALQLVTSGFYVDTSGVVSDGDYRNDVKGNIKKKNFFEKESDNPRVQCLLDIIDGISEKTIIFCKYTQEINTIVKSINQKYKKNIAVAFNGELTLKKRQSNLDLFKESAQFLVANKTCAGFGLNLQFCSYVIFYDNDYDYGTRSQAEDRVHRIGQKNNVHIIDICAADTLDESIIKCLNRKENILDSFRRDLEEKTVKEVAESYIKLKNIKGKKYIKHIKNIDKSDLKEG